MRKMERKEVLIWLRQAQHDIEVARYNLEGNMLDASAFYSQQAAEKALKSVYILKFRKLWKIHDLVKLAREINATSKIIKLCAKINPVYTAVRYPDIEELNKKDVKEIFNASKEVLAWVKKKLKL
ncbi:MAG: HEPN domain-containing protein [Candidatus Aenigmarchaeota archaeon]|nr:HEPN domain-containing protein [Candidatus Aenigmarchaeota archaeon]